MYKPEDLAAWYFRLNGYLAIPNFVLHRDDGGQRTEVDVVGVRFPYRDEFGVGNVDDPALGFDEHRLHVILAEVKRTEACPNPTWTNEGERNLHDILRAIGFVRSRDVDAVAAQLYRDGRAAYDSVIISLVFVGERLSPRLAAAYPSVPFRRWNDVLQFVFSRFSRFDRMKSQNDQWDGAGRKLWDLWLAHDKSDAFCVAARQEFNLRR
jgi:hypothetical protein